MENTNNTKTPADGNKPKRPNSLATSKPKSTGGNRKTAKVTKTEQMVKEGTPKARPRRRPVQHKENNRMPLKIIPLGGLGEIGKNLTVFEYGNDILLVDCGIAFPDDDMPGIDVVLPDFYYLQKNRDRIRGMVLTHGHEDHIGGIAYLLKDIAMPVYGTRLTLGLLEGKFKEHGLPTEGVLHMVSQGDTVRLGAMSVEFFNVNHSIPDACGLIITTPIGVVVHTGDFKIDYTPIQGEMMDLPRLGEIGRKGVLALMSDSTNAERAGSTPSERRVGESFEKLFQKAGDKRIVVASFSSNVHRIQQIIDTAVRYGRKVAVSGRSMENVVGKASQMGYLKYPEGTIVEVDAMRRYPDEEIVIITTGSQGEPMSALTRMARGEHRKIHVTSNDFIIISATPIPGNEKLVGKLINELMKLGAEVVYESAMGIHVSGHASRDDLKLIFALVKPKFYIPVHGEYKHLIKNAELALDMGMPEENIFVADLGNVIEVTPEMIRSTTTVPVGSVMVDGLGVGDVGSVVLRDRKMLAEDGLMVVVIAIDKSGKILSGPDVVSRGFVYVKESDQLLNDAKEICRNAVKNCNFGGEREWTNVKNAVREQLSSFLYSKTKRRPMILPIIQTININ